ncbi:MAG: universal stress protein [Actinobacteria bacterium]|jgi:nucleotide-binding universal stress UspA family protein|nr:universal stress protein [Actinomycetota bacterium]
MYLRVLVLLDGSELSEMVFRYAAELTARLHVDLDLLHVCEPEHAGQLPMRQAYIEQKVDIIRSGANESSSKYGHTGMGQTIQARGSVLVGDPAEEILEYMEHGDVDLVMMSTHGSSGAKGWHLGNVSAKVMHNANIPIWLVPARLREEIISDTLAKRNMVIPLSGSKQSEAVISHAVGIAERRGAESDVVLLHVLEDDKDEARMREYLNSKVESAMGRGVTARTELLHGDPATAIVEYVTGRPTQLLVMATRGHSGLSKTVFGSVTENVINLVKETPLLLVQPDA